ncbi:hypothetical protein PVBG_05802, partial [Plasmodium vivax Brazil I]
FSDVKTTFSNVTDTYFNTIKKIEDPILQHISLYLVNNYNNFKSYFSVSGKHTDSTACKNLNRWLDQKKSIYTRATNCTENKDAWEKHIEPLWIELENKNDGNKCNRYEYYHNT